MNRKISVSVALAVTVVAMAVTFAITMLVSMDYFNQTVRSVTEMQAGYAKLSDIDTFVRGNYYGDIDDDLLDDTTAQGYLNGINDKYSVYYSDAEYAEIQEFEQGTRVGIGMVVIQDPDGYFRITRVFPDSPAEKAGVRLGGLIAYIDDVDTKTLTSVRAVESLLRGLQGTELNLTCLYNGADEETFTVQRDNYLAPALEYRMVGDFGYLRIYDFTPDIFGTFEYAVNQAVEEGAKGLVFDLRSNPGTNFQQAYSMIDMICPRGTVAKSEGKNGTLKVLATSDDEEIDLPMAVLVNDKTSAAAELFACSVRDLSGGTIVGTTTAGKWMLQSPLQRLTDGSAVSVTVAKLLSGKDENFEGTGLTPDVEAVSTNENPDILYNPDPPNDYSILRALEAVRSLAAAAGENPDDLHILDPEDTPDATSEAEDEVTQEEQPEAESSSTSEAPASSSEATAGEEE